MKKAIVILLLLFGFIHHSFAQTDKVLQKKLDKADELIAKNKTAEAEKLLLQVTKDYPSSGDAWDKLSSVEEVLYLEKKQSDAIIDNILLKGNFKVTIKDSTGKETTPGNDSLAQGVRAMLSNMSPTKVAFDKFMNYCKEGCLHSNKAYRTSTLLRRYLVDSTFDTAVNYRAITYFNKAETEFFNKNYNAAIDDYHQALEIDSNYYKCRLYLGDAYYFLNDFNNAIKYYSWARSMHQSALEPLKYLADAYDMQKDYNKAWTEIMAALLIYPDYEMFAKWSNNLGYRGGHYTSAFIPRDVPVIVVGQENVPAPTGSPWQYYQDALLKAAPYCNKDGIFIKDNDLTKSKYLEVYAWEYMLSKTTDPRFDLAKKAQKDRQLEAFVLIGNFQYDFYKQYKDFVANSAKGITDDYFSYMSYLR